jgi:hypothetical protein
MDVIAIKIKAMLEGRAQRNMFGMLSPISVFDGTSRIFRIKI